MDELRSIFPGHPTHLLERALNDADRDLERAIDIVLHEPQEQAQRQYQERLQQGKQLNQKSLNPLPAQRIRQDFDRPLLSPSTASANSFGSLRISDDGDDDGYDDDIGDDDNEFVFGGSDGMEISGDEPLRTERERNDNGKQMEQVEEEKKPVASQEDVIQNVLSIFPDACLTHIAKLYREYCLLHGSDITEFIANKLAETDYPKSEHFLKAGKKRKRVEEDEKGEKSPDYEANDRPPVVGERYDLVYVLLLPRPTRRAACALT